MSDSLFKYLRSMLQNNVDNVKDAQYIMISQPTVVAYEQVVVDWAIKILEKCESDFARTMAEDQLSVGKLNNN